LRDRPAHNSDAGAAGSHVPSPKSSKRGGTVTPRSFPRVVKSPGLDIKNPPGCPGTSLPSTSRIWAAGRDRACAPPLPRSAKVYCAPTPIHRRGLPCGPTFANDQTQKSTLPIAGGNPKRSLSKRPGRVLRDRRRVRNGLTIAIVCPSRARDGLAPGRGKKRDMIQNP